MYSFVYSQDIQGKIIDTEGNPIFMSSIVFYDVDNRIIKYTTSDETGLFYLKIDFKKISKIEISCIGFKTKKIEFNNESFMEVILEEDTFNLKEVEIIAKELKDTIDINISDNLTEQSSLKEILNKDKDLQISDNGAIFYEGKPIRKILINKKEVFVNQNNLALDNITKEMIDKIQIISNYKDKFSFNFDGEKNIVINIDTKKNFKGVFKNNIGIGAGFYDKYNVKFKSMFFSDKFNLFMTNSTNNLLERDFIFENNNAETQSLSSEYYKNIQNDFISDDRNVSKSFLSSSSITLRKETDKTKFSLIIYQNYLKNFFNTRINRFDFNDVISDQQNSVNVTANLNLFNFQLNRFIGKKNILTYDVNFGVSNRKKINSAQNIFNNSNTLTDVLENLELRVFNVTNTVSIKRKVSDKLINIFEFYVYNENTNDDFENNQNLQLAQNINLKSSKIKTNYLFDYNLEKFFVNFGIEVSYNDESLEVDSFSYNNREQRLSLPLIFRGDYKKINYFLKVNSSYWSNGVGNGNNDVGNSKVEKFIIPISFSGFYKINRKENFNLFFERDFSRNDITFTIPEFYKDVFTRFFSETRFNNILITKNNLGLQYTFYDFSKSCYFSISSNGSLNFNTINYLFTNIEENVLNYVAFLSDKQVVFNGSLTYSKGWYFPNKLHKISVTPRFEYIQFDNKASNNFTFGSKSFIQKYMIAFEPNKWLIKEISLSYTNNSSNFIENSINTNNLTSQKYNFSILGENRKIILKSNFYIDKFDLGNSKFTRKDINLNIDYKLNKKFNLFLHSNSLLTLFRLGNEISNVFTSNNQGITTVTTNPNILGFVVMGINLKF